MEFQRVQRSQIRAVSVIKYIFNFKYCYLTYLSFRDEQTRVCWSCPEIRRTAT